MTTARDLIEALKDLRKALQDDRFLINDVVIPIAVRLEKINETTAIYQLLFDDGGTMAVLVDDPKDIADLEAFDPPLTNRLLPLLQQFQSAL